MIVKLSLVSLFVLLPLLQVPEFTATPENLGVVTGILLSLLFGFVPGFASWFDKLGQKPDGTSDNGVTKSLFMLGLMLLVSLAIFGMSCTGILFGVACSKDGAVGLFWTFAYALSGNQITYLATRKLAGSLKSKPVNKDPNFSYLGKTQWPGEDQ